MNEMFSIDDLPITEEQKERVLEWFARKLWIILEEGSGEPDYHHKSYDPLTIDDEEAWSYVFGRPGRQIKYKKLEDIEAYLSEYAIEQIQQWSIT